MSRRLPRSARVARRRAPRVNPWVQLALLVVGLVVLLSFWQQIADGTAGCYSHMAAEDAPATVAPAAEPGPPASDPRAVSVEVRLPSAAAAPSGADDAATEGDDAAAGVGEPEAPALDAGGH